MPAIAPGRMMNAVGGTSIHWTCQSWRLMPWNFKQRSETIRRYGAGRSRPARRSPTGRSTTRSSSPTTTRSSSCTGVSGKAGNIGGTIDPRGNVFEGPRRREYPLPPLRRTGFTEFMADAARRLGWHPFAGPAAIRSQPYNGLRACEYHGFCTWGGCHVDAKGSTNLTAIPMARRPATSRSSSTRAPSRSRSTATGARTGPLPQGRQPALPAGEGRPARGLHVREHPAPPPLDVAGLSERPLEQPRPGRAPLPRARPCRARTASSRAAA